MSRCIAKMCFLTAVMCAAALPTTQSIAQEEALVEPLSAEALEVLVAEIAVYSNPVVENVLAASQNPAALHEAANNAAPTQQWPPSLHGLLSYPGLLQQLDENLAFTARLGIASKTQLPDVWHAIDSVRVKMEIAAQTHQLEEAVPAGGYATGAAAGQATGSVTQTSNGATFQSQASGSFNSNVGAAGTASRNGQGNVSQNADGSTNFNRTSNGSLNTTNANVNYSHSGSGQANGNGSGSYQGSSTINTAQGSAQTNTTAGSGQASTTVSTSNSSNTYTAGDGQIGSSSNKSSATSATAKTNANRPTGVQGNARFRQPNPSQARERNLANSRTSTSRPSQQGFGRPDVGRSDRSRTNARSAPREGSSARSGGRSQGRSRSGGGQRGGGRR